ncbi:hypothetical protein PR048_012754 [Dryococelus australis]|uniref:Uncharacterized protein n=1 Tax=Dryococelus australis TaxID=614101 RepID=A0ABQ9HQ87_9NEOP|nr:hypothetical protein PR048_012754 [Dryococelus australis]
MSRLQVCKKTFTETLGVSRDCVQNLCRKFMITGSTYVEKREDTQDLRTAVRAFIESIRPVEKFYYQGKNVHRQYLASDLNIDKLHLKYSDKCAEY